MDAVDQAALVDKGEVTPLELLEAAIERIERIDPVLNAVVIRWFDHARDTARADLPDGPFRGVPFLIKDLFAGYAGQRISNGNLALKNEKAISDADTTLVSRFRDAGLVIAGRTNSPELGSVPTTEPLAWGATHNPWDTSRSPGGSSGGSAAAVASGMVPFAHASDGGGSIRIPASCCGLVGLKPSQGRISLGPIRDETALSVELCVSRTVRDTATLLDAVRGPGIGDTVIAPAPSRRYVDEVGAEPGRLRIGLLDHHPQGGAVAPECAAAVRSVASLLESLGHTVEQAWPAALEDTTLTLHFGALWSTNMGVGLRRFEEQLGRPLTEDEFEPMNRVQAEIATHFTAVDYALAFSADHPLPPLAAGLVGRWLGPVAHTDGGRTSAAARRYRQQSRSPDGCHGARLPVHSIHAAVQHERPARDQRAGRVDRRWAAGRYPASGRLWARRRFAPGGQPTGGRQTVGAAQARGVTRADDDAERSDAEERRVRPPP